MTLLSPPAEAATRALLRVSDLVPARVDRGASRSTPIAPAIVIIVVAVAAFLALAAVIGAIAAYIYFCQSNGLGWPGLSVPGPEGGVYKLGCYK